MTVTCPGPKRYEVVCLTPETAADRDRADVIQCHVEAFSVAEGRTQSVYIESEDWRVPVEPDGTAG